MTLVPTRVLVINQHLSLAVKLKQALESFGGFEVTPFTTADAALDYLRRRPQDVVLVDFLLPAASGLDLVLRVRGVQPDIAIIASPDRPEVGVIAREMGLHGVVDLPVPIRTLIPLIRQAVETVFDGLPDTAEAHILGDDTASLVIVPPPTLPEFSSLDSVLVKVGGLDPMTGTETLDLDAGPGAEGMEGRTIEFVISDPALVLREQYERTTREHPLAGAAKEAVGIFHQLAAEEPPMPTLEGNGTVGDLMIGVGDTNLRQVVEILKREVLRPESAAAAPPRPAPQEMPPAQRILQVTLDETLPLDDLLTTLDVAPLKDEKYVREPDFLADIAPQAERTAPAPAADVPRPAPPRTLPEDTSSRRLPPMTLPELDQTGDLSIQTTRMTHPEELLSDPAGMETDILPRPVPPPTLPEMKRPRPTRLPEADRLPVVPPPQPIAEPPVETAPLDAAELAEFETDFGTRPLPTPALGDVPTFDETAPSPEPVSAIADPRIAQLALSLTERSLESTAEAILLTREGQIAAYDGRLPMEDIEELGEGMAQDWEAGTGESRIRFVTLRSSGQDFMIISRGTESGYTLSMIFAGNMPLHSIRRQLDRLIEALYAVPEAAPPVADAPATESVAEPTRPEDLSSAPAPVDAAPVPAPPAPLALRPKAAGAAMPFTYIWLVRDPVMTLENRVAQSIIATLDAQLTEMGWGVRDLSVKEDYVYLLADVPGEMPQNEVVDDLKRITAHVAQQADPRVEPVGLWADSYLTLMPGRAMTVEEIQRFIHFARMRG